MIVASDGLKTTVTMFTYGKSQIDYNDLSQLNGEAITMRTVDGHERELVEIETHTGSIIVSGEQLILAAKKCLLG